MAQGILPDYLDGWAGREGVVGWLSVRHVDDTGAEHIYRYSWDHLGDPISYYGGRKKGIVLDCQYQRSTSDDMGVWQTSTLSIEMSDSDQEFRRQYGNDYQKKLEGAEIWLEMLKTSDWIAKNDPVMVWRGKVKRIAPTPRFTVQIEAEDLFSSMLDQKFPLSVIDTDHFPNALPSVLGMVEPIVYGTWEAGDVGVDDATARPGGEWPTIYTGDTITIGGSPTWRKVLVCRHAVKSIDAIWLNGQDVTADPEAVGICAPGTPNWPHGSDTYVDIAGRRYTLFYVNTPLTSAMENGSSKIAVALKGVETAGDGSGTLIEQLVEQWAHFLDNYVFPASKYETGAYLDENDATWSDGTPLRSASAFAAAASNSSVFSAWGVRQPTAFRDLLTQAHLSGDMRGSVSRTGQYEVYHQPLGLVSATSLHGDPWDLIKDSLEIRQRPVKNIHPYNYRPDANSSGHLAQGLSDSDATSIAAHGVLPETAVNLDWLRLEAAAESVISRRKQRTAGVVWDAKLSLANPKAVEDDDVGGFILVRSREGLGGIVGYGDYLRLTGPSNFWRLGEQPEMSPATALDRGASPVNGTYAGSPQLGAVGPWDDGSTGLEADGSDDEITLGSNIATGTTCTIVFWFRPEDFVPAAGASFLVAMTASGSQAVRWLNASRKIDVLYSAASHPNNTALTFGAWYHVAISISAGSGTFYINGVADGTFSGYGGYSINRLLRSPGTNTWSKGGFKDIAVYVGAALSAGAIQTLYARRKMDRSAMGWDSQVMQVRRISWDLQQPARLDYELDQRVSLT